MRSYHFLLILFLAPLTASGQTHDLKLGASIGANYTSLRNYEYSYGGDTKTHPDVGWSAAATGSYELGSRFRTTVHVGGLVERTGRETFFGNLSLKEDLAFSWAEGIFQLAFLPIARTKFELQTGTGIAVRRIIKATAHRQVVDPAGGGSVIMHDVTDKMNNWNYSVPFSLTGIFNRGSSGTVLLGMEFQYGLADLYEPYNPPSGFALDQGFGPVYSKSYSISLKAAFMMPVGD